VEDALSSLDEHDMDAYLRAKKAEEAKKKRMKGLSDYVNQHTMRKLLHQWNTIQAKFETSSIEVPWENSGSSSKADKTAKALYVSDFALLLCSPKIKIKSSEFSSICEETGVKHDVINHRFTSTPELSQLNQDFHPR
jgi:cellobiose-specific phosphotransferase system component IIB